MKKILNKLVLIAVFFFVAQSYATSDEFDKKSDLSFFIGLNYFIPQEEFYREGYDNGFFGISFPFGLNFGSTYRFDDNFKLRFELINNNRTIEDENLTLGKNSLNTLICYNFQLEEWEIYAGIGPSVNLIFSNIESAITASTGQVIGKKTFNFNAIDFGFLIGAGLIYPVSESFSIDFGLNYGMNNLIENILNKFIYHEPNRNWYGNVGGLNLYCNFLWYY
ncbi:MAG: outer membrane beta-barrel protein [bacterium]